MFNICRNTVDDSDDLINQWINYDEIEDAVFLIMIMELYKDVTEHFI